MKLRYLLFAITLPVLMTGCGLVAGFVPPIALDDPFGVEGQEVQVPFGDVQASALQTQAESSASQTVSREFADQDLDLRGFSLARLNAVIGLATKVTLQAPVGARYPEQFALTQVSGTAKVEDAVNGSAVMTAERGVDLTFDLNAGSCTTVSCEYSFSGNLDDLKSAFEVSESNRGKLADFVQIIRLSGGNSQNTGSFRLSVTADSEPSLSGFTATFTLRKGDASIKLGG